MNTTYQRATVRLVRERAPEPYRRALRGTADAVAFLSDLRALDREHFEALHLDGRNCVIARETISVGTSNEALVQPREVFRAALLTGAAALIVAHNHPSGDPAPSAEDIETTRKLRDAGELIGVRVFDHVILAAGGASYYSFAESGLL